MKKPFQTNVSSKYGAPMGRYSATLVGSVTLEKVPMVDGDYDEGGAYWGGGSTPLFCAWNAEGATYLRAKNRAEAITKLPGCTVEGGELTDFVVGYLECALFAENDESNEQGGEPLDANYTVSDIDPESVSLATLQCQMFMSKNAADLAGMDPSEAGYYFWLSRNGHGASFRDQVQGEAGERLSKSSRACGEVCVQVDDGKIYFS